MNADSHCGQLGKIDGGSLCATAHRDAVWFSVNRLTSTLKSVGLAMTHQVGNERETLSYVHIDYGP